MTNEYEVRVTQDGKKVPEAGDIIVITLNAKGTANLNVQGQAQHRYIVVHMAGVFGLVPLFGLMKGKVPDNVTFKKIPQLVENLNDNRYIADWVVEEEAE